MKFDVFGVAERYIGVTPEAAIAKQTQLTAAGAPAMKRHFEEQIVAEQIGQNRPDVIAALQREMYRRLGQ